MFLKSLLRSLRNKKIFRESKLSGRLFLVRIANSDYFTTMFTILPFT